MAFARRALGFGLCGLFIGTSLAVVSPSRVLASGTQECRCTDDGPGSYKCLLDHTGCKAGTETCVAVCEDEG